MAPAGVSGRLYNGATDARGQTLQDLRTEMRRKHVWASRRQIARWHGMKLLPQPRQRRLGKGHGTTTEYAPGFAAQLVALIRLRKRERRLRFVGLGLWLEGYPIPLERIRPVLVDSARWFDRARAEWAKTPLTKLARAAERDRRLGRIRRRLGPRMDTLLRIFGEVMGGAFQDYDRGIQAPDMADSMVVERAFGLTRARTDSMAGIPPWLPRDDDLSDFLGEMSTAFAGVATLERDVLTLSDADLIQIREDLLTVQRASGGARAMQSLYGRGSFGFGELARLATYPLKEQAAVLVVWILMRRIATLMVGLVHLREGLAGSVLPSPEEVAGLDALKREIPEIAAILDERRVMRSARTDSKLEEVSRDLGAFVAKNPRRVKQVLKKVSAGQK